MDSSRRGGRRRSEARREALLDATAALLAEHGYAGLSTRSVAIRAQASKETLYTHFGNKRGLLESLVSRETEAISQPLRTALQDADAGPLRTVLETAVAHLLALVVGAHSTALNRAAIAALPDRELAEILLCKGRDATGALFEELLAEAAHRGELAIDSPRDAFGELFGLAVRDSQVRALLGGGQPWTPDDLRERARHAVDALYRLHAPR